ncbi:DUF2306 domain-containing protein [Hymenobacter sp. BT186]|uniref:DUF2306 domain-containing protein n=1 Tax=Hymenobacter telluris TaxID=2816474 RepID=A0A939EV26_9BACT|nr:DUF2306 domain-containing protein [Hymenobacter telluris]MBO0357978.1 DUF2306 domain-containing protein [Hymenobacter telluris]MBW3374005.1 DUF2306 domain-containing protein [Hymenobacter norwichensis]
MPVRLFVSRFLRVLVGVAVAAFSVLMLTKVLPYLRFEKGILFLTTKPDAVNDNTLFRLGFYVHITSSWWVMVTGLLQLIPALYSWRPKLHRTLGKIYVLSILLLAAPSGLILAAYANGGLAAKVGFTMQCLVWWLVTWQAYRLARQRHWLLHSEWMLRAYAVTLAAMSLRLESYGLYYFFHTKPIETYLTVVWLSWTGNLLLAEVLVQAGLGRWYMRAFQLKNMPKPRVLRTAQN